MATAVTSPSRWEHLEMLQDSSLFTPPGLELYAGDRVLAGKFSSSHCLFVCWFSSLLVILWLFSRSRCLPGTHQQCLQTGSDPRWGWVAAGRLLELVATATGLLQASWPSVLLTWLGWCTLFPVLPVLLPGLCLWLFWQQLKNLLTGRSPVWGGRRGREIWCLFPVSRPFSSFLLNLMLSIHFVAKDSSFLLSFVLISYCAGVEITSSSDISYSCISAVALDMAPIAITTIRYPGENLQVLKFLRQAWLFYN